MDIQHSSDYQAALAVQPIPTGAQQASPFVTALRPWWQSAWWPRLALVGIILLAGYFRTMSLTTWDAGTGQHPDERFFRTIASTVHLPSSSREYFDSARSPVNPRNYSEGSLYVYGPFPILLTRMVAVSLTPNGALPQTVPTIAFPPTGTTNYGPPVANPELGFPKLLPLQLLFNPDGRNLTTYDTIVNVGRSLAVLFDLGSILLIFLIARRVFSWRVGLLAALLSALAVMQIQQSHFFVDPIFSTFFVLLTIYWSVRAAQDGGAVNYLLVGLSIGTATANRITLATLGLVAIVATIVEAVNWSRNNVTTAHTDAVLQRLVRRGFPLLCMAGLVTLLTFRTLQPDAFVGSTPTSPVVAPAVVSLDALRGLGFLDVRPEPRFISNLSTVSLLVSGEYDFPPSQQWVGRTAYLFPWQNMVLWGMGPALGLAAWVGWLLFIVAAVRRWLVGNEHRPLLRRLSLPLGAWVLWAWTTFYFVWQGAQFAITMRYLLPIYGALLIFAAWLLVQLWDWGTAKSDPRPVNHESQNPTRSTQTILEPVKGRASRGTRHAALRLLSRGALVVVVIATFAWAYAFSRIYTQPHSRVTAAEWLAQHAPPGSQITYEIWDDPLPLQVTNATWDGTYRGIATAPYAEDEPQKYFGGYNAQGGYEEGMLDQLERADYVALTSNRVYDSISRSPMRYPALMRYYHSLFDGDLGFELVADITSYPRLLGVAIPDQSAEEAFSVYDHPRVLIFQKTPAFSRERAEALITNDVNWGEVYKSGVSIADRNQVALRLTDSQWPDYKAGGTWSAMFDRQSWTNAIAPLVWLLVIEMMGLAAFALLFRLLPELPDRGLSLSKIMGTLVVVYGSWLQSSNHFIPFTPLGIWMCAVPLVGGGAFVAWRQRLALRSFWRTHRTTLITGESVFLAFFALGLLLRWLNPDLWHPARGGEKPMDFAFFNAVMKSPYFPAYDPWFAGGYINYYYFGFVVVGSLTQMTGIVPSVAYNLSVATIFALTALGAWGVVFNLLAGRQTKPEDREQGTAEPAIGPSPSPLRSRVAVSALLAPIFLLLLGSLAQAIWYLNGYAAAQANRPEWAFWDATRIVNGTVNEFPFFTFLFGDLHAHMLVMPFSLALLGFLVALVRKQEVGNKKQGTETKDVRSQPAISSRHPLVARFQPLVARVSALEPRPWIVILILIGWLSGALRATNTWDYPTFVGLAAATLGLLELRRWQTLQANAEPARLAFAAVRWFSQVLLVVVAGTLFFLPFLQHFATESSGVELWRNMAQPSTLAQILTAERTSLWDFVRMYGLWLFVAMSAGLVLVWRYAGRDGVATVTRVIATVLTLATVAALLSRFVPALAIFAWLWSAPMLLVPLLATAAWLAWQMRRQPLYTLLPLLWVGTSLALCLLVEVVVVRGDVGRMNTVFKFGLHAWMLFALGSAVAVPWLWSELRPTRMLAAAPVAWAWRGATVALLLAALVYPLTATPARAADRFAAAAPRSLDGTAFMGYVDAAQYGPTFSLDEDAAAIAWMQQNIDGTPVILEAHQPSYQWAGRVATQTGLPTILGWEWHEIQQRSVANAGSTIAYRQSVVAQIYNSTNPADALDQVRQYSVEYIYVGGVEHTLYSPEGLAKFTTMAQAGDLEVAFTQGNTTVYRVVNPGQPTMLTSDLAIVPPQANTPPQLMLDQPVSQLPAVNDYAWNSWINGNSWLALALWIVAFYGLALLGLPLAVAIFGRWRDGGFVWARLIGLLVVGYAVWLPTSLGLWRYDRWGLLAGLLLTLVLNLGVLLWLGRIQRDLRPGELLVRRGLRVVGDTLHERRRGIAISEGVFFASLLLLVGVRALNPDLWHPVWGGEKPMEFGFLNAILRSPVMPPYDPFFSDGYINYYYYGLYLVSLPMRATGIDPAIAFNLAVPTLFALTAAGSYAIVAQVSRSVQYGVLGVVFVALVGNLAGVLPVGWSRGVAPVLDALRTAPGSIGERLGDWYIGPSRVIPNTINEFPFFSYLFADLHPHMIALPITLLMIALAFALVANHKEARVLSPLLLAMAALALGALAITNSWDFPTYALLIGLALVGAAWRSVGRRGGVPWLLLARNAVVAVVVAVGGLALYAPFFDSYHAFVSGIGVVKLENGTTVTNYLVLYGLFLIVLLPLFFGALWRISHTRRRGLVPLLVAPLVLLALVAPFQSIGLRAWLAALLVAGAVLLLQRRIGTQVWFALLLATVAWAVSLGIETVFIRDHLAETDWYRMNTVFKFGLQIWVLLALAAANSLPLLLRGLQRIGGPTLRIAGATAVTTLTLLALVYPIAATPSRIANRFPVDTGPTLDGLAFMHQATFTFDCAAYNNCQPGDRVLQIDLSGDADAVDWLNREIVGTPIVVQSPLWFYRTYGIRIAANTGLPTVISGLHADEQRDPFAVGQRNSDIEELYRTPDIEMTLRLLAKYKINYVYIGSIERAFYNPDGLAKFAQMRGTYLDTVYDTPDVQIYQVRTIPAAYAQPEPVAFDAIVPPAQPAGEVAGLDQWEQEVARDPGDSTLAFGLAERYRDLNRLDDAARVLQSAALANPNDVGLHQLWGDVLAEAGRYSEAEQAYIAAAQAEPTAGNWNKLGTALTEWGELDKAEIALSQAITIDVAAPEPHYQLGVLYAQQGKPDFASEQLSTYLELDPNGVYSEAARQLLEELRVAQNN